MPKAGYRFRATRSRERMPICRARGQRCGIEKGAAWYTGANSRHCERSEAIQNMTAEGLWIASSQSLPSGSPKARPGGSPQ